VAFDTYQFSGMLGEVCAILVERLKRRYAWFKEAAELERGKIKAQRRLRKKNTRQMEDEDKPVVRPQERA
jgi:5-methylcytosine-specific restriction endonuclease McrBC regulatory subunit McrC